MVTTDLDTEAEAERNGDHDEDTGYYDQDEGAWSWPLRISWEQHYCVHNTYCRFLFAKNWQTI